MQTSSHLFGNVPTDYLAFMHGQNIDYPKVVKFLDFEKKEVAQAANVPVASVRYDEKMTKELGERIAEWGTLVNIVAQYFQGDINKTTLWFSIPNPLLGNIKPRDMIRFGRYRKLYKFIWNATEENKK